MEGGCEACGGCGTGCASESEEGSRAGGAFFLYLDELMASSQVSHVEDSRPLGPKRRSSALRRASERASASALEASVSQSLSRSSIRWAGVRAAICCMRASSMETILASPVAARHLRDNEPS